MLMHNRTSTWIWMLGLLLAICTLPASVWALGLHEAKQAGYVGEQPNGYLGIVKSNVPPEVRQLVRSINEKRRERYRAIAQRTGTTLRQVELLAGKKAIEKTPPGYFIRTPSGKWIRKR